MWRNNVIANRFIASIWKSQKKKKKRNNNILRLLLSCVYIRGGGGKLHDADNPARDTSRISFLRFPTFFFLWFKNKKFKFFYFLFFNRRPVRARARPPVPILKGKQTASGSVSSPRVYKGACFVCAGALYEVLYTPPPLFQHFFFHVRIFFSRPKKNKSGE